MRQWIEVDPPRQVELLVKGQRHTGWLKVWRQNDDGSWVAYVNWYEGLGLQHMDWHREEHVQPVDGDVASLGGPGQL